LKVVQALDEAHLSPTVALWAVLSEYGDQRLVLAARALDQSSSLLAYRQVGEALKKFGLPSAKTPTLLVLRLKDPFVVALRKAYANAADTDGLRLGGQSFGGRYIEDGYAYRIR
jgi:hypothetical protein